MHSASSDLRVGLRTFTSVFVMEPYIIQNTGSQKIMKKISPSGAWEMRATQGGDWPPAVVPGAVCQTLMAAGQIDDPFYRDNGLARLR